MSSSSNNSLLNDGSTSTRSKLSVHTNRNIAMPSKPSTVAKAIRSVLEEDFGNNKAYVAEKWSEIRRLDDFWAFEWAARKLDGKRKAKLCLALDCSDHELDVIAAVAHRFFNKDLNSWFGSGEK